MNRTLNHLKKHILLLLFTLFTSFWSFSQQVELVRFKSSDCTEEKIDYEGDSILFKNQKKGSLVIKIGLEVNCCTNVSPSVSFKNNILNLSYEEYGEYCNCICYFEYEYTIVGLKKKKYELHLNNKKLKYTETKQ